MTSAVASASSLREPALVGQTVVLVGGSAGIGLETARRARAEGADVILTGRNPERLEQAAHEVDAQRTAAFDANDEVALGNFFQDLPTPIDHVMVTAGGPHYRPLLEMNADAVRDAISGHIVLALDVARNAVGTMRPGGTLLFMGGTEGRRSAQGLGIAPAAIAGCPHSQRLWHSSLRRSGRTSSPPALSTHHCRHHYSAIDSTSVATNCERRSRSAGWSDPPTSPRWPSTS